MSKDTKAYLATAAIISVIILLIASVSKIKPGEVGIVVNPFGDNKGIEKQELTIGIYFKESFFNQVHANINAELNDVGFNISHVYIIGKLNVPEIVTEALNRKIEATQKAQQRENELRESEAEAKKIVAKAKGEAESLIIDAKSKGQANDLINKSLTPELLKWKHIEKWDGKLPSTMAGSDSNVLLNIK